MIEAIQVAATESITGAAGGATAGGGLNAHASPIDVRDFGQSLQRTAGAAQPQQAAGVDATSGASGIEQSQGAKMFVSAFDNLNNNAKKIQALSESMSSVDKVADLTPGQMLEMTMQCNQFLFQSQLTSNVANRTSDGVQQLFRQQS